jgi:hypothetical protein
VINSRKLLAISFVISIGIFISVSPSKADEKILATITNNANSKIFQLIVDYNSQDQTLTDFKIANVTEGNVSSSQSLPLTNFIRDGLHFEGKGNQSFAEIKCLNFDDEQGGIIVIDLLYNIITGRRKTYEVQLAKDNIGWKLFYKGHSLSTIFAISNKLPIIGVVGTKELVMR